jgi:preprotein translocase subunit SecA
MDDLKQSVQNATYEQKDPLMIYKFEGFELFKKLIYVMNEDIVSFLFKADIPREEAPVVQAPRKQQAPKLQEQKAVAQSAFTGTNTEEAEEIEQPKAEPIIAQRLPGRNDKVSVQYIDGTVKKDVKFKAVEEDFLNNKCVLIEE